MVRILAVLSLLGAIGPADTAHAHAAPTGWRFPPECCGGHDCYEIDASEIAPALGSWHILASGEFFSAGRVRPSPDGRYYRCSYDGDRRRTTNCLFLPAPNS